MKLPTIHKLPNNLQVVCDHIEHVETVSLGLFAGVGSRFESAALSGISHFVEHMVFKGTSKRNLYQISEAIEARGGVINAWTSKENTAWYSKVLREDAPLATDIICDIVTSSTFPQGELEKEKKVVVEEIKQAHDDPDDLVYDYFSSLVYPENSLGRNILGPEHNIWSFSREDLFNHVKTHYRASNMVFVASGKFDENKLLPQLEQTIALDRQPQEELTTKALFASGKHQVFTKEALAQNHIIMAYQAVGRHHKDYYAYTLLAAILGRGMSSRLFKEIREIRGLVYSIYSYFTSYEDTGYIAVQASCSQANTQEVISVSQACLGQVLSAGLEEGELQKAKNQLISSMYMSLESSSSRMNRWAHQLLHYQKLKNPSQVRSDITTVSEEDIKRVLSAILSTEPSTVVLSG